MNPRRVEFEILFSAEKMNENYTEIIHRTLLVNH